MITCPNCKFQIEKGKFCPECGTPLTPPKAKNFCPTCNKVVNEGKFCLECGTPLTEEPAEKTPKVKKAKSAPASSAALTPEKELQQAHKMLTKREYAEALKIIRKYAKQDNPVAELYLGDCYSCGYGVRSDYEKAASYYQKAAASGNALANERLGLMYQQGCYYPQDYDQAAHYFKQAYDLGYKKALKLYENCVYMPHVSIMKPVFSLQRFPGRAPVVNIQVQVKGKNIKHRELILSVVFYYDNGDNLQGPLASTYDDPVDCDLNGMLGSAHTLYATVDDKTFDEVFIFHSESLWPYPEYRGDILILAHMEICEIAPNGNPIPYISADYRFTLECVSGFLGFPKFKLY